MSTRDEVLRFIYETEGQEGLDAFTEAFAKASTAGGEAGEKLNKATEELSSLLDKVRDVEALQGMQERLAAIDEKLAAARDGLAKLNETFTESDKSSAEATRAYESANKAVADLSDQHDRLAVRISTAQAALNASGVDTRNLGAAHDELGNKAKEAAAKLADAAAEANRGGVSFSALREAGAKVAETFKSGGEHILEFGKRLAEITGIAGVVASALATISGFKFFEKGVEEARSGENALAKLKAAVDGNAQSFEKLKETAEHAAESVGTTSNVAVETLTKLTAQLGNADAAAKALPATLTLAKAAQIEFNEAAELVATTLKSFGIEADQAGVVADKLAAIAARTGVNLGELARGAAQVAPLAKEAHVSFDQVASALAELSAKGFDAQKSNAALRELFLALSAPASKLRQDLVGLGVDTSSFGSILDGLRKAGDRGTEALQQLSAKGRAGVSALVQGGSADLERFQQILDQSGGAASKTAKIIGDTLDGALKAFGRTVDNLAEDTVKEALPAVETELKKLNEELKDVGKSETFKQLKEGVKDFVGVAVKALDEFVHTVDWKELGNTTKEWAKSVSESIKSVGENAKTLGNILGGIGDIASGLWNVVKIVFSTIESATSTVAAGITGAISLAYRQLGVFSDDAKKKAEEWAELSNQYAENAKEQWAAGDKATEQAAKSLGNLIERVSSAGDAAKAAAPKHEEHAKALEHTAELSHEVAEQFKNVTSTIESHLAPTLKGTQQDLDNAVAALAALQRAGVTTGPAVESLQNLIAHLNAQMKLVTPSTYAAGEALRLAQDAAGKLGITLQDDLAEKANKLKNSFDLIDKSAAQTAAGMADRREAFLKLAAAQLEATKNLDEGAKDQARYALESKAAALGLSDQLAQLEKSYHGVADSADAAVPALDRGTVAMEKQAAAAKQSSDAMQDATGIAGKLAEAMAATRAEFAAVSETAAHAFDGALQSALKMQGILPYFASGANDVTSSLERLRLAAESDVVGIDKWYYALAKAQADTTAKINEQRDALNAQAAALDRVGQLGTESQQQLRIEAGATLDQLKAMDAAIKNGTYDAGLLGKQDLQTLQTALQGAIQRTEALENAAKAADAAFESMAKNAQDALDQEAGNVQALEDRRHAQQLADLKASAEAAGKENSDAYQNAVNAENQLHDLKMKHIADQANAQKQTDQPQTQAPTTQQAQQQQTSSGNSSGGGSGGTQRFEIAINGFNLVGIPAAEAQKIADFLAPYMGNSIVQAIRNAGGRI